MAAEALPSPPAASASSQHRRQGGGVVAHRSGIIFGTVAPIENRAMMSYHILQPGRWHAPSPEGEFTYLEFHLDEITYNLGSTLPEGRLRAEAEVGPTDSLIHGPPARSAT